MYSELKEIGGTKLSVEEVEATGTGARHLIWGHGWGQSAAALLPLAQSLKPFASSSVIDFPGFGKSPAPPESWGTAEYADCVAELVRGLGSRQIISVGHSFGGRVGLQIAARHPELLSGLILIAGAGLKRRRTLFGKLQLETRRLGFKTAKLFTPEGPRRDALRDRFGSRDYRSAGALRPVFVRVVSEDLTEVAKAVQCPTLLLYGSLDAETPPEFGERFHRLIPRSELAILEGFDHLNVLTAGRHQLTLRIRKFLESFGR